MMEMDLNVSMSGCTLCLRYLLINVLIETEVSGS